MILELLIKSQLFLNKYKPIVKSYLISLFLIVRGLNQDKINVRFRTTISRWYSTAKKVYMMRNFESWEFAHT